MTVTYFLLNHLKLLQKLFNILYSVNKVDHFFLHFVMHFRKIGMPITTFNNNKKNKYRAAIISADCVYLYIIEHVYITNNVFYDLNLHCAVYTLLFQRYTMKFTLRRLLKCLKNVFSW